MWELDHKESWALKNWCFWTVVLKKTLESPLDNKEIKPVHPQGNKSWIFIGRTDAEAEAPIPWPPDEKSWLIRKDPDAGKDWRQEEKGMTEDEMVGWYCQLKGHDFEQAPGDDEGQEAGRATVHGLPRVGHYWATEQQQQIAGKLTSVTRSQHDTTGIQNGLLTNFWKQVSKNVANRSGQTFLYPELLITTREVSRQTDWVSEGS